MVGDAHTPSTGSIALFELPIHTASPRFYFHPSLQSGGKCSAATYCEYTDGVSQTSILLVLCVYWQLHRCLILPIHNASCEYWQQFGYVGTADTA